MSIVRRRRRNQFLFVIIPPPIQGGIALIQTESTFIALVQTGTLKALIQTGSGN